MPRPSSGSPALTRLRFASDDARTLASLAAPGGLSGRSAAALLRALENAHTERRVLDAKLYALAGKIIEALERLTCDDECSRPEPDTARFFEGCMTLAQCSDVLYTLSGAYAGPHPDNPDNRRDDLHAKHAATVADPGRIAPGGLAAVVPDGPAPDDGIGIPVYITVTEAACQLATIDEEVA